jgi:hypothetical protein
MDNGIWCWFRRKGYFAVPGQKQAGASHWWAVVVEYGQGAAAAMQRREQYVTV